MPCRTAAWLVVVLIPSGCLAGPAPAGPYALGGTFTESATQADFDDFAQRMARHGGTVLWMESFPVQFRVSGLSESGCVAAHDESVGLAYVAHVQRCHRPSAAGSDAPTVWP